jgi:hypothetical protein
MQRFLLLMLSLGLLGLLAGCCGVHRPVNCSSHKACGCDSGVKQARMAACCTQPPAATAAADKTDAARADVIYACDCGAGCTCNTLSKTPGQCSCGKPLRWHHVLKVEDTKALLCSCSEGCMCKLDPNDPGKCGCGQPVKQVDLKGSGLLFCNCGGSCTCNHLSETPGTCGCGMPLKQAK